MVPEPRAVTYHQIVVGTDGSTDADQALRFAFEEAVARRSGLRVVHAFQPVFPLVDESWTGNTADTSARDETQWLHDRLAPWTSKHPEVRVRTQLVQGHPAHALASTAISADLLVVGCRGGGGFHGLRLGSVSHGVLSLCRTPVAIIRETTR